MPLLNKAQIDIEVAEFRAMCDQGAPTPSIPSDRVIHNDIAVRAFACGAEWANLPETEGDEAKAIAALISAVVTGFKCGLAIRARKAVDDSVLSATEIG